jgi:hypothetical protein
MKIISGSKIRHYAAVVGIFLIMSLLITGIPGSYGVSGNDPDTSQNLEIWTWHDLDAIRDNLDGHHILMNDLDSTTPGYTELASPTANEGKGWQPIGYGEYVVSGCGEGFLTYGLTGTLDGQGFEICDLFIHRPEESALGLFAYLDDGGIIKNVGVVNGTVIGYNVIGTLVGHKDGGTVSNCYSTGNVAGHAAIGGLTGRNTKGTIRNSYSTGSVSAESSTGIGGLVGQQHSAADIVNSYSTCSVVGGPAYGGSQDIGGLLGENYGLDNVIGSFWDTEASGQTTSDGGTGKNTTEMQNIATFSGAGWNIIAVALNETNPAYIWNIVDDETYPFLSWQS